MATSYNPNLYIALIHYPVVDRHGNTIASSLTNLDLHDIARVAKTYGIRGYFVVTPLPDQQELARRIVAHWTAGYGARFNPNRCEALELIRIEATLERVIKIVELENDQKPDIIVTGASNRSKSTGYDELRNCLKTDVPHILLFGTAWGLSGDVFEKADYILKPVIGSTEYNHLSVRSAAAIILDRLLAPNR